MAILFNAGRFKATDKNNDPIPGAFLAFYATQTSTFQPIYADSALSAVLPNPVKADANGLFPEIWLDDSLPSYKVVHTFPDINDSTQPGSIIWTILVYNATLSGEALLPLITPQTDAERNAGATPVNYAYPPGTIDRYTLNESPGNTDTLTAINAAILVAFNSGGGIAQGIATTYFHSAAITMLPGVTLRGVGKTPTVFLSSHPGDGIKHTMALNQSNNADWEVRDCTFKNTNSANIGGGLVDVGGTFVRGRNVRVNGFAYSRIFDQSELADDDLMDYEGFLVGGVWLVNGADHTPGASSGYTNRISVKRSQFNSAAAGAISIIDDGGAAHTFEDNNYNLAAHHFRIAGCKNISIVRGEYEVASGANILFRLTTSVLGTSVGGTDLVTIEGTWMSPVAGTAIVFTGAPTGSSGTLTSNWGGLTGQYNITFSDGQNRTGTLTNGSTAVTWTVAVTGSPTASGNIAIPPVADIPSSSLTGLVVRNNRFITSAPTIIGIPNISTLFAYGNEDSNVGVLFDGMATNHFEHAVARNPNIVIAGHIDFTSYLSNPLALTGAAISFGAGTLCIGSTTAATATAGAATLPANPLGFMIFNLAGTPIKVPYYSN